LLKKSKEFSPKQASKQHVGNFDDGMTGAPVTGLEYKHVSNAVLEKINVAAY
jgi:hypothetical protein